MFKKFPYYRQLDAMDCGPTCLRMIADHYGRKYTLQYLREHSYLDREGVSLRGIIEAAETIGMSTMAIKLPFEGESEEEPGLLDAPLPLVAHWKQNHLVVVYKVDKKHVWVADPAFGKTKFTVAAFRKHWESDKQKGIALL